MKSTQTHILRIENIQYALSVSIVVSILIYGYLLCSSVAFAVAQRELVHHANILQSDVAQLESEYLAKSQDFTHTNAITLGLVDISKKTFLETTQPLGRIDTEIVAN
ncbi:MAG: hypothetical protein RI911_475 [Candidatus Parcubacteria bacterium]|jgi:hypothetical protein